MFSFDTQYQSSGMKRLTSVPTPLRLQISSSTGWSTASLSTALSCTTKRAACSATSVMRTMPTWCILLVSWAPWLCCQATLSLHCSWTRLGGWGCWVSRGAGQHEFHVFMYASFLCCVWCSVFFSVHQLVTTTLFFPSVFSGLQCDLVRQLFLPVFWQQWVSHDCSALPVRGNQHCLLECLGCADRRALPLWQEVGNLGMPWNLADTVAAGSLLLNDVLNDVIGVAPLWLAGLQGWMTLWGEIIGGACDVDMYLFAVLLPPNGNSGMFFLCIWPLSIG